MYFRQKPYIFFLQAVESVNEKKISIISNKLYNHNKKFYKYFNFEFECFKIIKIFK